MVDESTFPPAAIVMMKDVTRESKWEPSYEGPFIIVRKNRGGAYVLRDELGVLKRSVTVDLLKLIKQNGNKAVLEENVYDIEKIIDHRSESNGKMSCIVVWNNPNIDASWEPVENFYDINVKRQYWKKIRPTRRAKRKSPVIRPNLGVMP